MPFEFLATELLFDAFEYLSSMDLFHAFNGLNARFDSLLIDFFRTKKQIDFRYAWKEDLTLIRRRYFPSFIDQIQSIYLSDNDTSPHGIDFFLSRLYPLHRFENLTCISLENISSFDKCLRILDDLQPMACLTTLYLKQCSFRADFKLIVSLIDKVWTLAHLTHCYLDMTWTSHSHFTPPTIISCSIESLIIRGVQCLASNLPLLYDHTPHLSYLSVDIWDPYNDSMSLFSPMITLTTFRMQCQDSSVSLASLFRPMSQLKRLIFESDTMRMDGHEWEILLSRSLPQLRDFELKTQIDLSTRPDTDMEIDRMIDSYRTRFWIDDHRWFIRCYWNRDSDDHILRLHTVPSHFDHFVLNLDENFVMKSTCPDDSPSHVHYDYVTRLTCSSSGFNQAHPTLNICFPHLRSLTLTLPRIHSFHALVPRLDNLTSLKVRMSNGFEYDNDDHGDGGDDLSQLQDILDQSSRLVTLIFQSWAAPSIKSERSQRKVSQQVEVVALTSLSEDSTSRSLM